MKALARRLKRLEEATFGTLEQRQKPSELQLRLDEARKRCGLPPPTPERLAELAGMGIAEILEAARKQRA